MFKSVVEHLRSNTFAKINITFVSILFVSIVFISVFSYNTYRTFIIKNSIESSRMNLDFIVESVDKEIVDLHNITLSILNNKILNNFSNIDKSTSPTTLFKIRDISKELKYLENSYPILESIWLYSNKFENILTGNGRFSSEEFFKKRVDIELLSGNDIIKSIDEVNSFKYLSKAKIKECGKDNTCISFIRSASTYSNYPNGQIVLNMNTKVFDNILSKAVYKKNMNVILFDKQGQVISSTTNSNFSNSDLNLIKSKFITNSSHDSNDVLSLKLNNTEYTGFITFSNDKEMQFVTIMDTKVLLSDINSVKLISFILIIICLFLSIYLTFMITNKMFEPIKKIIKYVKAEQQQSNGFKGNYGDIFIIEQFIEYMKKKSIILEKKVNDYTSLMQENMMIELIYTIDPCNVMKKYNDIDIAQSFPYKNFSVAIISAQNKNDNKFINRNLLCNYIFELQKSEKYNCLIKIFILHQNDKIVIIINSKLQAQKDITQNFINDIKSKILLNQKSGVICAYGKTYQNIINIYDSFQQALNIYSVKANNDTTKKLNYEKALNFENIKSSYTKESETRLINLVKSINSDGLVKKMVLDLINENSEKTSTLKLESLFIQLIITINKIISDMNINSNDIYGKDINHYRIIDSFSSTEDKKSYIIDCFEKLTAYIRSTKESKAYDIYQQMLSYVVEGYNTDISLNDISYKLGLSSSYLSNVFKEFHQSNFLDYLNNFRITKAKEILSTTDCLINEVAIAVGYTNINTFIRIFKKIENVTPGQYRLKTLK